MGKSVTAEFLEQRGCSIIDTDLLARQVVEPGEPALAEIERTFGPEMIGEDGRLRREELARHIFSDPARRRQLEAILHPRIRERWLTQAEQWRSEGRSRCVVVIPLLFETQAEGCFDKIICVACSAASQWKRLGARGWSDREIEQRVQAQWPIEKKMVLANYVVWTEGKLEVTGEQVDRILAVGAG